MKIFITVIVILVTYMAGAQQKPFYYHIPDTPANFTAATVAARMVDGLGFRYYWSTEGLTEKDLQYRPSPGARTNFETLEHIQGLTEVLLNAVSKRPNNNSATKEKHGFTELREKTLNNIQKASELLKQSDAKPEDFDIVFERPNGKTEFPFWNVLNGPLADALWHVGQVVSFRRGSGNPLPTGVDVLRGVKTN
jgi:hypothetical protein